MTKEFAGEESSSDLMPIIVLCGGAGTRLSELTRDTIPKHLIEVSGKTILEYALEPFIGRGSLILATGLHGSKIREFAEARGTALNLDVKYSHDPEPKGVVSAILRAIEEHGVGTRFVITHGDEILKGLDLGEMHDFHQKKGAPITVATVATTPGVRDFAMWRNSIGRVEILRRRNLSVEESRGARFGVGTFICEPDVMSILDPLDSWEAFLRKLIARRSLFGYPTEATFYNLNTLSDLENYQRSLGGLALGDES